MRNVLILQQTEINKSFEIENPSSFEYAISEEGLNNRIDGCSRRK